MPSKNHLTPTLLFFALWTFLRFLPLVLRAATPTTVVESATCPGRSLPGRVARQ